MTDGEGARARQKARTRQEIIRAAAEAWSAAGVDEVPLAAIAEAADVSERTLYNHFPNRDALLGGLSDWIIGHMREAGFPDSVDTLDQLPDAAYAGYRGFSRDGDLTSLYAQIQGETSGQMQAGRDENTDLIVGLVAADLPHLSDEQQRALGLLLRGLTGSRFWHHLTRELELADDLAGEVVAWAVQTLVDRAGDDEPVWPPAP